MTSPTTNRSQRTRFVLQPCALAIALLAVQAASAQTDSTRLERVEITGSSIKRIDGETALPVQVIKREDIDKSGVTTAAELLKNISANTAPLSDGASITDGTSGQRGFNGANLRGIGVSSTLVLLNGRRLANFASPGDNAGVDLNNIPAGAIQRVEILKDGASAIYGTDAIGGVINFITRKDYQGVDLSASIAATQEGGAGKKTASISGGFGDLNRDRFNVFGVLDVQQLDALRSSQRDFIKDRPLASNLPALMSSNTYPANIDISGSQRNALIAAGVLPAGTTRTRLNPSSPTCSGPATVYAPQGPGGPLACSYDYIQDTEIYPEASKIGFIGRATLQAGNDHQVFAELVQSEAESRYVLSPNPQRIRNLAITLLPEKYRKALLAAGQSPTSTFSGIRYRMTEAGNRTNEVTSTAQRLVLGASGMVAGWDYDLGLSRAQNKAVDKYVDGYVLFDKFDAGVRAGTINPFGPSSQAGLDLINSIKVNDEARKSKGVSTAIDGKISKALMALAGGDLALALGAELRRENTTFTPSALLLSNNIAGDRDSGLAAGSTTDLKATDDSRTVGSVFAELNAPITRQLELQLALRHDHYSEVGSTTNPKIGLRWQPEKNLLLRASAGTGFRAPSLADLKRPTTYGSASSFLTDPQCVKDGLDTIDGCTDQWPVERRSNPNLKPEKSAQFSLGLVFEAGKDLSFSVDYWNITKKDVISTLGEQIIVDSPDKYNGKYIQRDGDGFITNIILQKENQGRLKTSGLDLGFDYKGAATPVGRFSAGMTGTLVLKYDRQFGPLEGYRSNLGVFLNDQVIQKWRHRISFGWDQGPFGLTLANQFSSGYTDQNTTYDPVANTLLPTRKVKAYSLWDLTGSWNVNKQLKVRAGVLNLLNTAPPFSNQAYYFLAGYDPTYTDPRGRSVYASVSYSFR
ncbi:TonB-dependent receptor [Roseateles toxinivorans]|uniref:Iron complex outermembrane receptor protein n=1 Tax=Roseateles toxinivorans TaxID=270368 RepID=A0A4R6QM42_9BURK|nr:TonB-dependent receptor [Roseateles toxinivorans]TDP71559.1 iron complex outermembrane receptor protein [Roseateles toxinivorans]